MVDSSQFERDLCGCCDFTMAQGSESDVEHASDNLHLDGDGNALGMMHLCRLLSLIGYYRIDMPVRSYCSG